MGPSWRGCYFLPKMVLSRVPLVEYAVCGSLLERELLFALDGFNYASAFEHTLPEIRVEDFFFVP